jgi:hypothetical protein
MKQTAVEWLAEELYSKKYENGSGTFYIPLSLIDKAKVMEKEQIIEAHIEGHNAPSSTAKHFDAEQYFKINFEREQ